MKVEVKKMGNLFGKVGIILVVLLSYMMRLILIDSLREPEKKILKEKYIIMFFICFLEMLNALMLEHVASSMFW